MFNTQKNTSVIMQCELLLAKKLQDIQQLTDSNPESISKLSKKSLKNVHEEIELLSFIDIEFKKHLSYVLNEVASHLTKDTIDYLEAMEKINGTQERMLIDSLKSDLSQILETCKPLKILISNQLILLQHSNIVDYQNSLEKEGELLATIKKSIMNDADLETKFKNNLLLVTKLSNVDGGSKILKGLTKFLVKRKYKMLEPLGYINDIPSSGPVVFASRHYDINGDAGLILDVIPRRVFIVSGAEAFRTEMAATLYKNVFERSGFIPVIRPESVPQYEKEGADNTVTNAVYKDGAPLAALRKISSILKLNQAILLFPEGHGNLGFRYTPKQADDGIIALKSGLVLSVELAQNELKKNIPIIPIGIIYNAENKSLQANFGKPMYHTMPSKIKSKDAESLRQEFNNKLRSELARLSNVEMVDRVINIPSKTKKDLLRT